MSSSRRRPAAAKPAAVTDKSARPHAENPPISNEAASAADDEAPFLLPKNHPKAITRSTRPTKAAYFNRELSWLAFNRRVLEQARNARHPLLERVRFLSIVCSNLDEFFEIRVAGLIQQVDSDITPSGGVDTLGAREQLRRIHSVVASLVEDQYRIWRDELVPALAAERIVFVMPSEMSSAELAWVRSYFEAQVSPVLTPLALDQSHPFPHLGNKTLNVVVSLDDTFARYTGRVLSLDKASALSPLP
jgi:polyphosphate kinase